jgi:uncharacterized protein (TIGR02594 family)
MTPLPPWYLIAQDHLGVREIPGKTNNPVIMAWATKIGGWIRSFYKEDSIPWCALFVNAMLSECGLTGSGSLAARSFETWGQRLTTPVVGAIAVFARKGGGHVGFYVGEKADAIRVLGGNQSDAVTETWIARDRLLGYRWPLHVEVPLGGPVLLASNGEPLSTNEA